MTNTLLNWFERFPLISTDTRSIKENSIFFALKGSNFDGNKYALKALDLGAALAVVDDESLKEEKNCFYVKNVLTALQNLARDYRKCITIPVIGLTGSNGKTTTKELLASVLSEKYNVFATSGNLNNHIGVPLSILSINTSHEIAILEMGANHQGEIELLSDIVQPNYGIITNVGLAHLEGFGGFDGVIKGKTELYNYIQKSDGLIFYNQNNLHLKPFAEQIKKRFAYSTTDKTCSVYVSAINSTNEKISAELHADFGSTVINSNLTGAYNAENIACCSAIALFFGLNPAQIKNGIEKYVPENNRSQLKHSAKGNKLILDAYNANPTSMENAILSFLNIGDLDKFFVLGDMFELGAESKEQHQKIVDLLISKGFKTGVLIGQFFKNTSNPFVCFETVEDSKTYFEHLNLNKNLILVKGSRGVKLEKIVDLL